MLKVIICIMVIFGFGVIVGAKQQPSPDVEFVKVPQTKIIYRDEDPPPVPEAQLSHECVQAVTYAKQIVDHAENIYLSGQKQLQIISRSREAFYTQNSNDLAQIQEDQQDLHGSTVGSLSDMEEALANYDLMAPKCSKDLP
jgi:hypothetical protein